jgi:tRNA/tmRNA/rRNA uracil-C5-methylase (TrmA/RlmC/RlmD family)
VNNIRYEAISVEAWLKYKAAEVTPDFVLLDPPRAGAGNQVIEKTGCARAPSHQLRLV